MILRKMQLCLCAISILPALQLLGQVPALDSHSGLEIKLSAVPIDQYDATNNIGLMPTCSSAWTIRHCMQNALSSYYSQGVTRVEFLFGICGGWYSTALTGCGTGSIAYNSTWDTKLKEFLADIYSSGISRIGLAPAIGGGIGGENGVVGYGGTSLVYTDSNCSGLLSGTYTVEWWPTVPYPIQLDSSTGTTSKFPFQGPTNAATSSFPTEAQRSSAYNCGPANTTNFVGWANLYTVFQNMLSDAASESLTVVEVDVQGEILIDYYPIQARYIVDNTHLTSSMPEDVLGHVQGLMTTASLDSESVVYSAQAVDSTSNTYDCGSYYGDSGRIEPVSAMLAAIGGATIGWTNPAYTNNLWCSNAGSPPVDMFSLAYSHTAPDILDVHMGPCETIVGTGCDSTESDNATEASTAFTDVENLLETFCSGGWRGTVSQLCSAVVKVETVNVQSDGMGGYCDSIPGSTFPGTLSQSIASGFNSSSLHTGRNTYASGIGVYFRAWDNTSMCYALPMSILYTPTP